MTRILKTRPLTAKQAEVYRLRQSGISYGEIGRMLGMKPSAATEFVRQASTKLRLMELRGE